MNRRNYYRLLHVQPDAPAEVIRAAYRALMVKHHPDQGGDHEQAVLLNEAWAVLSDPARRAAYDTSRGVSRAARPRTGADARGATTGAATGGATGRASTGAPPAGACPFCNARVHPTDLTCSRCTAPLTRVKSTTGAAAGAAGGATTGRGDERRRLPRVSRADWATLRLDWQADPIDIRMRNLSLEGLSFFCGAALPANARVRITAGAFDAIVDVLRCARSGTIYVLHGQFVTVQFAAKAGGFVYTTA